ncbi:MAG: purine-nucleoside phosphorylase [Acidobacteriota bacterium]
MSEESAHLPGQVSDPASDPLSDPLLEPTVPALQRAVEQWEERGWPRPKLLLVAGSGLSVDLGKPILPRQPLDQLFPFPVTSLPGHEHSFELLEPRPGHAVLSLRGRIHAYQGYTPGEVVFAVRLARLLGAHTLVMTNASGGLASELAPGDLVMVEDQLNLSGTSPLTGTLPESWGPRFPDLSQAYDPALRELASRLAEELKIPLKRGVYAGLLGPAYETPAEVRMLQRLGADLVGMSTVMEVLAARHMGMRCLVFSLVSNLGAGVTGDVLTHEEVLEAGQEAAGRVGSLLSALLRRDELYTV